MKERLVFRFFEVLDLDLGVAPRLEIAIFGRLVSPTCTTFGRLLGFLKRVQFYNHIH